ncbi:MAG: hypothetical protein ACR2GY_06270 [Phycisphaerales bacterium]
MENVDIAKLLKDWPFEPGRINARIIDGDDGQPKLQIRVQMGVMQLELEGRPDGERPEGFASLLELQSTRAQQYREGTQNESGFILTPEECQALREEAVMYYHRYVALFALEEYPRVIADATRNLAVLDLCRDYAAVDDDRAVLEQFRPYILMMRVRALAAAAINQGNPKAAVILLDEGMHEVRSALEALGVGDAINDSNEMQLLQGMRDALRPQLPTSQRVELEERLRAALAAENYELAAILRDELRMMK